MTYFVKIVNSVLHPKFTRSPSMQSEAVKLVIVGDVGVGKSSLKHSYECNAFPGEYLPVTSGNYTCNVLIDGLPFCVDIWDTAGQENVDKLRRLSYFKTDAFLVCYSIENRHSLNNIDSKWVPELRQHCPGVPIVLVACKIDLRTTLHGNHLINAMEGKALAKKLDMLFFETSSLQLKGLHECVNAAIRRAKGMPDRKHGRCTVVSRCCVM
ncbi:ras-related protein ced-10-like isoform X1 [Ostrea edulis]|uniref:ras-related protein ced-10-like isoform X1 n=1 Tax=Ostrea edulis TaxID=37623 RepID=UPI0020954B65|nr:ras-related protein ced-10-like isoform X1 [Ostrea edulis]